MLSFCDVFYLNVGIAFSGGNASILTTLLTLDSPVWVMISLSLTIEKTMLPCLVWRMNVVI